MTSPFMVLIRISGPPPLRVPLTIFPPVIGGNGGIGGMGMSCSVRVVTTVFIGFTGRASFPRSFPSHPSRFVRDFANVL